MDLEKDFYHLITMASCHEQGIKIYPVAQSSGRYPKCKIVVEKRGEIHEGDMLYDQKKPELSKRIFELYDFYYKQIKNLV